MESDYKELQSFYSTYFSIGYLGKDFNTRVALIALICHVTEKLRKKYPNITHYKVIKKIIEDKVPNQFIVGLSIICYNFSYGCTEFPTFGLQDKEIPRKIKSILLEWLPF